MLGETAMIPSTAARASVLATVRGLAPSLSPAEGLVADQVLARPADVAMLTITQLAAASGTSTTTITRFCRSMGLRGYQELRLALATAVAQERPDAWSTRVGRDIALSDAPSHVLAKLVAANAVALQETAAQLDPAAVERSVEALGSARRVDLYAVGGSAAMAQTFQLRLHEHGQTCHLWTDIHGALTSATRLGPDDVALGVSHSGETVEVIEPLLLARSNGARTIALTSFPRSTLAMAADLVLATTAEEGRFRRGGFAAQSAQLLVFDCLYIGMVQRSYRTPEGARAVEEATAAVRRALERHRRWDGPASATQGRTRRRRVSATHDRTEMT